MAKDRWIIVGGGLFCPDVFNEERKRPGKGLIAADGGLDGLYREKILPDIMIGDFDSVSEEALKYFRGRHVPEIKLNTVKDATDMEEAVTYALKQGAGEIVLLGATGSRLDHVHANIELLRTLSGRGVDAYMRDANNKIRVLTCSVNLHRKDMTGKYFSLFPFSNEAAAVSITGAAYPLKDVVIPKGSSLGTSNYVTDDVCHIEIKKGSLLLIESCD